jgi:putative intracellular protease/amidase
MVKVAIVCTSSKEMPHKDGSSNPSGAWLEETAAPYLQFKKAGIDVDIVSIAGGNQK